MLNEFKSASWPAKLVAICVVGILLGLGLCGIATTISHNTSGVGLGFLIAGAISFWVSALGLIVAVILLVVIAVFNLRDKDR
jgi:hypothetical protein